MSRREYIRTVVRPVLLALAGDHLITPNRARITIRHARKARHHKRRST